MTETRAEFLQTFRTPTSGKQAFRFGRESGYAGHGRLSFAEFFNNEPVRSELLPPRTSRYRAYRRGHAEGKEARAEMLKTERFICKNRRVLGGALCGFETDSFEEACAHAEEHDHWIESHAHGDTNRPVLREIHASEQGGLYVQDYRRSEGEA